VIRQTNIVKIFKGVTGLRMSRKFPDIESKLWRGMMWSPSYYVGTAGNVSAQQQNIASGVQPISLHCP
jgi:putative transposase